MYMHISPETGFIVVWSKQTILVEGYFEYFEPIYIPTNLPGYKDSGILLGHLDTSLALTAVNLLAGNMFKTYYCGL